MNQRKAGILLSFLLILVNTVVNLLYVPLLLSYMGINEYGLYRLMGSIFIYFSLMDFGLSSTLVWFYTRYKTFDKKKEMENLLAMALLLYSGIGILVMLTGGLIYFYLEQIFSAAMNVEEIMNIKKMYILLLINILIVFSSQVLQAVIIAHEKFIFLKGMNLIFLILQPVVVICVIVINPYAFQIILVQFIFNVIMGFAKIWYALRCLKIRVQYHFWDWDLLKNMVNFTGSIFIIAVVDQILWQSNQIILGMILGTTAVASYAIGAQIYTNYMSLSMVVTGVYLPRVTEMEAKREPIQNFSTLFIRLGRIQFFLLAWVLSAYILFGREFISIWAGVDFNEAYWIALLIIIPFTIDLIQNIGISILQAKNLYGFRARVFLVIGILNLFLAIPAARMFGGIGCALVTGSMILIGPGIVMNWYYGKIVRIEIKEFWRQIIRIAIPVFICTFIGMFLRDVFILSKGISFIIKILFYTILYIKFIWHFAMNSYEKNLFWNCLYKMNIFHNKVR